MTGETNLSRLIAEMNPVLNKGSYVFVSLKKIGKINRNDTLFEFKEKEGVTLVLEKNKADDLQLVYNFVSSWITLKIHSSLEAVGLTATFSSALATEKISCNVVSGYFHDHIFVAEKDANKAIEVLIALSKNKPS